jgi:NADH-ubiquinone oxidoreductase chain 4
MSIFFLSFSLWGAFLCSLICLVQTDLKALIAYSSVSHMGVILTGLFNNFLRGVKGFIIIIVSHAFCSSALFFIVGYHYERRRRRQVLISRGFRVISFLIGSF